jgi:hypothetical protein
MATASDENERLLARNGKILASQSYPLPSILKCIENMDSFHLP